MASTDPGHIGCVGCTVGLTNRYSDAREAKRERESKRLYERNLKRQKEAVAAAAAAKKSAEAQRQGSYWLGVVKPKSSRTHGFCVNSES